MSFGLFSKSAALKKKIYFRARKFRRYKAFDGIWYSGRGNYPNLCLHSLFPWHWTDLGLGPGECLNLRGRSIVTLRAARLSEALLPARRLQPSGFGRGSEGDTGRCQPSENSSSMFDNENDMLIYTAAPCSSSNCVPAELWHIRGYYMNHILGC